MFFFCPQEVTVGVSEISTTLRVMDVTVGQTRDLSFSAQADVVRQTCEDLCKEVRGGEGVCFVNKPPQPAIFSRPLQMDILRPAVQQAVELWGCFGRDLREVSLLTNRLQRSLGNQPLFSLKQTEGHVDFLQVSACSECDISHR